MLEINTSEYKRCVIFEVIGRVDSNNAAELGAALDGVVNDGQTNLIVDLSGIEYLGSAGIREIMRVLKRVWRSKGDLRLCALSDDARRVLDLAGLIGEEDPLAGILKVYPTQAEAVGSF